MNNVERIEIKPIASFVVKSVYGREMIYPVNPEAVKFASLTGRKTVTKNDLLTIKALGFDVMLAVGMATI